MAAPARAEAAPPWPAYLGAGACAVLAIAAGLPWLDSELVRVDGFDIPIAALVSDAPGDGIGLGLVLVILAGIGLLVALLSPTARALLWAFLAVGGVCTLLLVWYLFRVASVSTSFGDSVSFGVWLALLAAITAAAAAVLLATMSRRGTRG